MKTQSRGKILTFLYGGCVCLSFIMAYVFGHLDFFHITHWACGFWDCVRDGAIAEFPQYLANLDYTINYPLFLEVMLAIAVLPTYLLGLISGTNSFIWCGIGYKTLLMVLVLLSGRCIRKIGFRLGASEKKARVGEILFLVSCAVQTDNLGKGQVDVIGAFLLLLAMNFFLEKKYTRMVVVVAISLLVKPFTLLFFVPVVLLKYGLKLRTFIYGGLTISVWVLDRIVTKIIYPDYYVHAKGLEAGMGYDFLDRVFSLSYESLTVFVLIAILVCAYCLYLGVHKKTKDWHYVLLPMILFIAFLVCVYWHSNWVVYGVPFLIIMGIYISEYADYLLLMIVAETGFLVYVLLAYNPRYVVNIMFSPLFYLTGEHESIAYLGDYLNLISPHFVEIGKTLMIASYLLILLLFWKNRAHVGDEGKLALQKTESHAVDVSVKTERAEELLVILSLMPVIGYILLSILCWLR